MTTFIFFAYKTGQAMGITNDKGMYTLTSLPDIHAIILTILIIRS